MNNLEKKRGISARLHQVTTQRFKLTKEILPAVGILLAAIVFSTNTFVIDLSQNRNIEGSVIRDLNKDGTKDPEDLFMGNFPLSFYNDLNFNGKLDDEDIFLGQTHTEASGKFSFEFPAYSSIELLTSLKDKTTSWSGEKTLDLQFSTAKIPDNIKIEKAWIEVIAAKDCFSFATTIIENVDAEGESIYWDHKPWNNHQKYQSPDLSKIIINKLSAASGNENISLKLSFLDGEDIRKINSIVSLHLKYKNEAIPVMATYEVPSQNSYSPQTIKSLTYTPGDQWTISYSGLPTQCMGIQKNGTLFSFNRAKQRGTEFSLNQKRIKKEQSLISDPVSGKWLYIDQGNIHLIEPGSMVTQSINIGSPFCSNRNRCVKAYTYHAISDELWVLDNEYRLWSIPIEREAGDLQFENPYILADWGGIKATFSGEIVRLAVDSQTESIYFLSQAENKIELNKINFDGSAYKPLGPLYYQGEAIQKVTGFEIRPNSEIWLMQMNPENRLHEILKIDPDFQLLSLESAIPVQEEINNCACLAEAPFILQATVFDDKNLNTTKEKKERILSHVQVLAKPVGSKKGNYKVLKKNKKGVHTYRTYEQGETEFSIDKESLPKDFFCNECQPLIVAHQASLSGISYTNNMFAVTHFANSPNIKWAGIRGELKGGGVQLEWATTKEVDAHMFEVLRSEDGIHYEAIGGVEPSGNSDNMKEYQYKDYLIDDLETSIVAYRIKMKGGLGKINYSPVAKIVIKQPGEGLDLDVHVHPSNESINLSYQVLKPGPSEIRILNLTGNVLEKIPVQVSRNGAEKEINVKGWSKGMYYAQLRNGNNSVMRRWVLK